MFRRCAQLMMRNLTAHELEGIVVGKLGNSPALANTTIIDVRTPGECEAHGMIPCAINIPMQSLDAALGRVSEEEFEDTFGVPQPKPDRTQLVFYCAHGVRSLYAMKMAEAYGFRCLSHYPGGFAEWEVLQNAGEVNVEEAQPQ